MQNVSKEYRESMKSPLRERAYIMLSFGIVNQEAQNSSTVVKDGLAPYSSPDLIFKKSAHLVDFATLEQDWLKVDGSMYFPPDDTYNDLKTGAVSENTVDENGVELTVNLNVPAVDIKGLTIDFGANYPVDFDILTDTEQILEVRGNTQSEFKTEEVLNGITQIKLLVKSMKKPNQRLRIYSMLMGYGLVFTNDDVIDSSMNTYVSPICEDLPQIDFEVKLKNNDRYFNVDNPKSAIHFIETGQEMEISYGYQLPDSDKIEWVKGQKLLCSEWDSDDTTATIRCQDVLRNLDKEFETSYTVFYAYNYLESILKYSGISNYYIDPLLKEKVFYAPIPRVSCKEALQIIANACRCTVSISRDNEVVVETNYIPPIKVGKHTGVESYSKVNILDGSEKVEYVTFAQDYAHLDGKMLFPPRDPKNALNTGYVTNDISNSQGRFGAFSSPYIEIVQEETAERHGLTLEFGSTLPDAVEIKADDKRIDFLCDKEIEKKTVVQEIPHFKTLRLEFDSTKVAHNRIVLNNLSFSGATNFFITKNDMTSSPLAVKKELVKRLEVVIHNNIGREKGVIAIEKEVEVTEGQIEKFYVDEPFYDFKVDDADKEKYEITKEGAWFVTVKYKKSGTYTVRIKGDKELYETKIISRDINSKGITVTWDNPIVGVYKEAEELADWLADYYKNNIEYEYDTRGNPELDALDIVYQENDFIKDMQVQIYDYTLNFNQAFSGKITARRIGG